MTETGFSDLGDWNLDRLLDQKRHLGRIQAEIDRRADRESSTTQPVPEAT